MANLPPVQLPIVVDDSQVKNALKGTVQDLKRVQQESNKTDKALDNAFDDGQVQQMNTAIGGAKRGVKDVGTEADKTKKKNDSLWRSVNKGARTGGRSISRFRRGLSGAFRATGIGLFITALASISDGFDNVRKNITNALGPLGDTFQDLLDTGRDFLSTITFGLISSSQQIREGLEAERQEIIKAARQIQEETLALEAETAIKRARIAGASEAEILRLQEEAGKLALKQNGDRFARNAQALNKALLDRANAQARFKILQENEANETRIQEAKNELSAANKRVRELQKIEAEIFANQAKIQEEAIEEEKERSTKRFEITKSRLDKEAEEAKKAQDAEEKRLKQELELRLTFLFDERAAQEERLRIEAREREEEVNEVIKTEEERAILIEAVRAKLADDIRELNDKFRKEDEDAQTKALNDQLKNEQTALEARILQRQSELEQTQSLQKQQFFAIEQTEKDIETFEALQQGARTEQELRFQKERLELVLRFGILRTEAEREAIEQQIATIDTLLKELNTKANQTGQGGQSDPDAGFLAQLFGLTGPQVEALKKATQEVIKQINSILDTRLAALDAEIQAREENLDRLDTVLAAETELLRAGEAANVRGTLDQIAEEEAAQEKALKKRKAVAIAKQTIDAATQASSLITASAQIFTAFAPLQPIGIPLAIATIASMFAAFAAAQATAFASIASSNVALNTGGRIMQGEKDTEGGRGLRVEGTKYVVGRGEWIVNARDSEEQNEFLQMLNAGMFRGQDLAEIAKGGASKMIIRSERKSKKEYEKKVERLKTRALREEIQKQTKVLSQNLNDLYNKPQIAATNDYYLVRTDDKKGNSKTKKYNVK